jgi:hypothetical protein
MFYFQHTTDFDVDARPPIAGSMRSIASFTLRALTSVRNPLAISPEVA